MAAGDTEEPRRRQGAARPGGERPSTGRPPERGPRPPAKLERRDVAWGEHRPQRGPASRETGFRDANDRPQRTPREDGYQGIRPNNFGSTRPGPGGDRGPRSSEGQGGDRRPQSGSDRGPDRGPRSYGDRPVRPFGTSRPPGTNERPARSFDRTAGPTQGRFQDRRPDAGRSWGSRPPSGGDQERPGSRRPTTGRTSGPSERFGREKPTAWGEARFAGRERPASSADRVDRLARPSRFGRDEAPRPDRSSGGASGAWRAVAKSDDRQWGVTPDRPNSDQGFDSGQAPKFERDERDEHPERTERVQRPERTDRARPNERSVDDRPPREPTERSERFPARREIRASDNPTYGAPRPQSDLPKQTPVPLADKRKRIDSAPGKPWEAIGWTREENLVEHFEDNTQESAPVFESEDESSESKRRRLPSAPEAVAKEVNSAVGVKRGARLEKVLMEASRAFERDRYGDSLRMLRPLLEEAPRRRGRTTPVS